MTRTLLLVVLAFFAVQCSNRNSGKVKDETTTRTEKKAKPVEVTIEKALTYDKHTLEDEYAYKDTIRRFQWDKIRDSLVRLETAQRIKDVRWATLQNYKNQNGIAPEVQDPEMDGSTLTDEFGVSRYQSIPLYENVDDEKPVRYGRDGALVRFLRDSADFVKICSMTYDGEWYVPGEYVKTLDAARFDHVIFVDRENQNITAMENSGGKWLVRSMNPATTGLDNPPYQQETPLGTFVIQEHKPRMFYTGDGHNRIVGYAPYASRFTRGGYIHGVPLNDPDATEADYIEFSPTLGTTPRSHMCVRTATSHAEFIYNWAEPLNSLVFVIE